MLRCAVAAAVVVGGVVYGQTATVDTIESVKIGTQVWMKKNLNIETAESWCYENSPDSCAKYGRLYTWDAAMKVCPNGWHLPTNQEWETLADFTYDGSLKSKNGWNWNHFKGENGNGTDDYGWSALPGGVRDDGGFFRGEGDFGIWWTATESVCSNAYNRRIYFFFNDFVDESSNYKGEGLSVRCLKDDH